MNLPDLNRRVKQVIDNKTNGNVNKFANLLNISQQKVNRLFNLDTRTAKYPSVPVDILIKITELFVDLSPDWLLTGKGDMLNNGSINKAPPEECGRCKILEERLEEKEKYIKDLRAWLSDKEETIRMLKQKAASLDSSNMRDTG